jgi:SP family arabinose:H+ symporter-like MFS transporter
VSILSLNLLRISFAGVVIRNYAPVMFEANGFSTSVSLLINVVLGLMKLLISIFSAGYMERSGRKQLLTYSTYAIGAGMLLSFFGFWIRSLDRGTSATVPCITFMVGSFLTIGGYSFGFGSVPWVLSAEMFPTPIRGWALSISLIASNAAQGITNFGFLPLIDTTSPQLVFFLFALMNLATFFFIQVYFVETRNLDPMTILMNLLGTRGARCLGIGR